MGAFFGSIHVRSDDRDSVKSAVEDIAREGKLRFLLGPVLDGWIAVYPDRSGQDPASALALAERLKAPLLQLILHDDDVLFYSFFRDGQLLDEYSSRPDYFEQVTVEEHARLAGKPEVFHGLLNSPEKLADLSRLLKRRDSDFTFEQDRLQELAGIFGISNALTSYDYLVAGEREGVKGWKQFIHIPDQMAEKAARKEALLALRREKAEWKRKGLLSNEWQPPCRKRDWEFSAPASCADPISGGFAVLWRRVVGLGYSPQLHLLASPWESVPQSIDIPFSSLNPNHPVISTGGDWLALYDCGLRLFDWRQRRPVSSINLDAAPVAFRNGGEHLLCQGRQAFTLLSLESMQPLWTIEPAGAAGSTLAVSPSNEYLVTRYRDGEFQRITLATGEVRIMRLSEHSTDAPGLLEAVQQIKRSGLRHKWNDSTMEDVFMAGGPLNVFAAKFSSDGQLLYCATSIGLRVYAFNELFSPAGTTPAPLHAVTPVPEALALNVNHYDNYVYDVAVDDVRNYLLFCGIEGTIRFLDLANGSAGILVDVPGKPRIRTLKLSRDRRFLCCLCLPRVRKTRDEPPRVQVWNYDALCKAAGIQ